VVDDETYDFGVMDNQTQGRHTFVFTNEGDVPLTLQPSGTSCKCTVAKITREEVPPGESAEVEVEWKGKETLGYFSHTASFRTNDPQEPRVVLKIVGDMTAPVRAVPEELVFSTVTAGQARRASFRVYGYRQDPVEITGWTVADPEHFDVELTPLGPEEVAKEKHATNGYLAEVTIKPGLPLGRFETRITLDTTVEKPAQLEVHVQGIIGSEIAILGPDWNEKTNVLTLGSMRSDKDHKRKLLIRVGGIDPEEIRFRIAEVTPDLLQVKLGETHLTGAGRIAVTPLAINIPKGTRPANYLGPGEEKYGRIRIETTHPEAREILIYVRFLVRD